MFFKASLLGFIIFLSLNTDAYAQYGSQAASQFCQKNNQQPIQIQVDWQNTPPFIDHSKTRQQLAQLGTPLISVYGKSENHTIGGLTRFQLKIGSGAQMKIEQLDKSSCVSFSSIHVTMETSPVIYVAADIPQGSCLYREVYNHELKHYNVENVLVRDYRVMIHNQLAEFAQARGTIGPFGSQYTQKLQADLTKQIEMILTAIKVRMDQERVQLQGMIDTREEYQRVAAACAGQR